MATPPDERARSARPARASQVSPPAIDGPRLRSLLIDACSLLQRHVAVLNAVNVFPVPDGDTGTNLHLTLRAALDELDAARGDRVCDVAHAAARGALMGARGNSGVILSQILRGVAAALDGRAEADGPAIAAALAAGAEAAHSALTEPVEGTVLTVARDAAEAVARPPASAEETLARATAAAWQSVERTPELLPVLKEAGIVDAGGLGYAVLLEGMLRSLRGDPLDVDLAPQLAVEAAWRDEAGSLHQAHPGEAGYCTEFIVSGRSLDPAPARSGLANLGTSLLVVGGDDLLRVHLHTARPDDALAYGRSLGAVSHVKVDNLEAQVQRFVADAGPADAIANAGIVAVAAGDGIEAAFRSMGATQLVRGGQTMNPSAGEILHAIDACPAQEVLVLPNNKNVIPAAHQAAEQSAKRVAVVPSRSVPQGVAAALALSPDLSFEANVAAMERALTSVRSAEVTRAVRSTSLHGRRIEAGQAIGLIEGALRVVANDVAAAVCACIEQMLRPHDALLTLYAGRDARAEDAQALAEELRRRYPSIEVELVDGGQPHYPYLISLE
ncbi:MAG: DAK2 domain-containing protein [Chloroflexi bacterium]|nr:DAK2 domain-containing protein [Chloroflexota bacterium]